MNTGRGEAERDGGSHSRAHAGHHGDLRGSEHGPSRRRAEHISSPPPVAIICIKYKINRCTPAVNAARCAVAAGSGNFVDLCAAELPLIVIAELMGVPLEDRHRLFDWSNRLASSHELGIDAVEAANLRILEAF